MTHWIGIDWGTSNVRAWLFSSTNKVLAETQSNQGMGNLTPAEFPSVFNHLRSQLGGIAKTLLEADVPAVICGMAGSKQGWAEAQYLPVPCSLENLASGAVLAPHPDFSGQIAILPGLCQHANGDEEHQVGDDVMRGEETQVLGFLSAEPNFSGLVIFPGTHSKWVQISEGRVHAFATAMTGELFALLRKMSVLKFSMADTFVNNGEIDQDAFVHGVEKAIQTKAGLTFELFGVRAGSLLHDHASAYSSAYLSGLLIGAEIAGFADELSGTIVPLVGSERLNRLYSLALDVVSAKGKQEDSTVLTQNGLIAARMQLAKGK